MSHSYSQNSIHSVFSTKDRAKLSNEALQAKLWAYIVGICKNEGVFVHAVGGTDDHLHCMIQLPATLSLAQAINAIKSNSSRWMRQSSRLFVWQEGYAAFSVSASLLPTVSRYIENQKAHHRKMSFAEEFRALLKKHGVEYDTRFVLG